MPINPNARFQVDAVCFNPPGICFICKSGSNGPFIRTGLKHDYYKESPDAARDGDVYICKACLSEMALTMEIVSTDIESQLEQARLAGVVDGVLLGKKVLDEYVGNFVDLALGINSGFSGNDSVPTANIQDDAAGEQQDSESADSRIKQGVLFGSGEGRDDLSGDRSDATVSDFL